MRVAALYDVHGNLPALEAVLDDVERAGVDAIVSGGDLVSGPLPVDVFERLSSRPEVRFVRGNADRLVVEAAPGPQEELHAWCASRLGKRRLEAVASWPLTVELDVDGVGRALFCHAVPSADEPIFARLTPEEAVAELLGDVTADVVVCGHTHVQFDRRLANGPRVVNAGSVGMPYEGRRGAYGPCSGRTSSSGGRSTTSSPRSPACGPAARPAGPGRDERVLREPSPGGQVTTCNLAPPRDGS